MSTFKNIHDPGGYLNFRSVGYSQSLSEWRASYFEKEKAMTAATKNDGHYYAKERAVFRAPIDSEAGTGTTMGFCVCECQENVEGAAEEIARALNVVEGLADVYLWVDKKPIFFFNSREDAAGYFEKEHLFIDSENRVWCPDADDPPISMGHLHIIKLKRAP